jgi:RimJ/RimL family protein N-acetyltransferase
MGPIVHLDLGLCLIRPWREQDAASLARHANSRRVWQNLRDDFPHPYTETHAARFLARAVTADPTTNFAIVVGGKAVGGIGYHLNDDARRSGAEVGYWLNESYWGRGIATAAVRAMTAFVFSSHGQLCRIYAAPFAWNAASARVLEKAGFTLERSLRQSAIKQGGAANQLLYAIVREEGRTRHVSDR